MAIKCLMCNDIFHVLKCVKCGYRYYNTSPGDVLVLLWIELNAMSYHTHLPSGCQQRSAGAGSGCRGRAGQRRCTAASLSRPGSGRPWSWPQSHWPWSPGLRSGPPYLDTQTHTHKHINHGAGPCCSFRCVFITDNVFSKILGN